MTKKTKKTPAEKLKRSLFLLVALFLFPCQGLCQVTINALNLQRDMCAGGNQQITFGTRNINTVVVGRQSATLGHSELIFLPDGVECDGSCSYRSPVTFTAFADSTFITSAQDIKYVRLNLEHSFIGDIYINITCPSGQKADIMRFAGSGTSACDGIIPQSSRSWLSGNNIGEENYFGMAFDHENSEYPCDASAYGNQAGTGWNYCWSSNTTSGYQYASGDGIVYRSGHAHNGRVDSSNVAAHTNFYHPDESFSTLVGCPLNGTWYIEVVDGFSVDNGYIFEWELSLDASLLPEECEPESYVVEGDSIQRVNDSTFMLVAPPSVAADTTMAYRFMVITTCGDTIDTTATVTFHPNVDNYVSDSICKGDDYFVGPYNIDTSGIVVLPSASGCDSIVHLDLTVFPTYDTTLYDSTCLNVPYLFENTYYSEPGTYLHCLLTGHGCDSLRRLQLYITSADLKAGIYASPLVLNEEHEEIYLKDVSLHHAESRWLIDGNSYSQNEMTLSYPVNRDSLEISLEATSNKGCHDTATVVARYDRSRMFIPNIFTPSLEQNDTWRPVMQDVVEIDIRIYNRQGSLVAHLTGLEEAWDGGDCPQGTYVYILRYRTRVHPHWWQERSGSIVMIR